MIKRFRDFICKRVFVHWDWERNIVDRFHKLYYESKERTWKNTFWLGKEAEKCPLDLWIYQEIIFDIKPDLIIETGTHLGGSALFLASICDLINKGKIISIDIEKREDRPKHDRIVYLLGSSTSREIVESVQSFKKQQDQILVILDSDHKKKHVMAELKIYGQLVTRGSYLIVEDTNINGHPVDPRFGPGPMEAVKEFLEENRDFEIDRGREKYYLSFNPDGYLKRIR